jgi:hypothetical protein
MNWRASAVDIDAEVEGLQPAARDARNVGKPLRIVRIERNAPPIIAGRARVVGGWN